MANSPTSWKIVTTYEPRIEDDASDHSLVQLFVDCRPDGKQVEADVTATVRTIRFRPIGAPSPVYHLGTTSAYSCASPREGSRVSKYTDGGTLKVKVKMTSETEASWSAEAEVKKELSDDKSAGVKAGKSGKQGSGNEVEFEWEEYPLVANRKGNGVEWTVNQPRGPKIVRDYMRCDLPLEFKTPLVNLSGAPRLHAECEVSADAVEFFDENGRGVGLLRSALMWIRLKCELAKSLTFNPVCKQKAVVKINQQPRSRRGSP